MCKYDRYAYLSVLSRIDELASSLKHSYIDLADIWLYNIYIYFWLLNVLFWYFCNVSEHWIMLNIVTSMLNIVTLNGAI